MIKYYSCFDKCVAIEFNNCDIEMLERIDFWIKKFTPSVKEDKGELIDCFVYLENNSKINKVSETNKKSLLIGNIKGNEGSIGKYVSQIFQKLVIKNGIIFVHGSAVSFKDRGVIIIGDYGQGKTSLALGCTIKDKRILLLSDNCVAIKDNKIIGSTSSISLRQANNKMLSKLLIDKSFLHSNRVYYDYTSSVNNDINISSFVIPHINAEDNNNYIVPTDMTKIYLFEKFTSLLKGETILFDGKFSTKSNANKNNLNIILKEISLINDKIGLQYLSCSFDKLVDIIVNELKGE